MAINNDYRAIGRLTHDPETRQVTRKATGESTTKASISLAIQDYRNREAPPLYLDAEVWGKQADVVAERARKGTQVTISGRLRQDSWTADDGTTRKKIYVEVSEFQLLDRTSSAEGSAEEGGPAAAAGKVAQATRSSSVAVGGGVSEDFADDELPPF